MVPIQVPARLLGDWRAAGTKRAILGRRKSYEGFGAGSYGRTP
jgi:hypothetical protein